MTEAMLGGKYVPLVINFFVTFILVDFGVEYLESMLSSLTVPWWLDVALLAIVATLVVAYVRIVPPPLGRHR